MPSGPNAVAIVSRGLNRPTAQRRISSGAADSSRWLDLAPVPPAAPGLARADPRQPAAGNQMRRALPTGMDRRRGAADEMADSTWHSSSQDLYAVVDMIPPHHGSIPRPGPTDDSTIISNVIKSVKYHWSIPITIGILGGELQFGALRTWRRRLPAGRPHRLRGGVYWWSDF